MLTLTDRAAGYRVLAEGTTGLVAPPYRFATDQYAGIDGSRVQFIAADPREVVLGMMVQAYDTPTLTQRLRALVRAMRPKAGPGTLTVTDETGQARTLACYYTGGLEGLEARSATLPGQWVKAAVHLYAPDPWWYGPPQTLSVGLGQPVTFFPFFPLRLSSSTVQGQFTVDLSDSDAPTYPLWTVTGPGSSLQLSNDTTGRSITIDATLDAGQTMTVDTRPGLQSVRRSDGANLLGFISDDSDPALWPLVEDVNQVTAALTSATSGSRIVAEFSPRYSGA